MVSTRNPGAQGSPFRASSSNFVTALSALFASFCTSFRSMPSHLAICPSISFSVRSSTAFSSSAAKASPANVPSSAAASGGAGWAACAGGGAGEEEEDEVEEAMEGGRGGRFGCCCGTGGEAVGATFELLGRGIRPGARVGLTAGTCTDAEGAAAGRTPGHTGGRTAGTAPGHKGGRSATAAAGRGAGGREAGGFPLAAAAGDARRGRLAFDAAGEATAEAEAEEVPREAVVEATAAEEVAAVERRALSHFAALRTLSCCRFATP